MKITVQHSGIIPGNYEIDFPVNCFCQTCQKIIEKNKIDWDSMRNWFGHPFINGSGGSCGPIT